MERLGIDPSLPVETILSLLAILDPMDIQEQTYMFQQNRRLPMPFKVSAMVIQEQTYMVQQNRRLSMPFKVSAMVIQEQTYMFRQNRRLPMPFIL